MQIILIKDHELLGQKDSLVNVKNGYARNFLIPKKIAIEATTENLKQHQERTRIKVIQREKMMEKINDIINKLAETKLTLKTKAGQNNRIFGRITSLQIAQEIKKTLNVNIDRKIIMIDDDIKELGTYKGQIEFSKEKIAEVNFEVIAE